MIFFNVYLSESLCVSLFGAQISRNDKGWKAWFDTEAPEESPIPDGYNTLDTFRKLLLVR